MKNTLFLCLQANSHCMKKASLAVLMVLATVALSAQVRPYPTLDDAKKFFASTTCIVVEDNPFSFYNAELKTAVEKYWKVTPYRFITVNEFNVMRTDPAYSFIVLTITNFSNDKSGSAYDFLNLLLGADVDNLDELPEFCAIPLSFAGADEGEYSYKMGLIVRFMQYHADLVTKNPTLSSLRYLKYYNKNVPEISKKTILVRIEDLAPEIDTEEKIKAYYPYAVKIVDEDAIISAVENREKDVLIFHKVGPDGSKQTGTCLKMLIGTDDAVMYYHDIHMVDSKNANGMLISDLKRIARF